MLRVKDLFSFIDNFKDSYTIILNCDDYSFKLHYWNLYQLYHSNVRNQIIEKMLLNNFDKIYIGVIFKNLNTEHRLVYNGIHLELKLHTDHNSVYIDSCKSLMKFKNYRINNNLITFFMSKNINFEYNIIEEDVDDINKLNFRKPIKISELKSSCCYEKSPYKQELSSSDIVDLNEKIYDSDSYFNIELYYKLFGQYFVKSKMFLTINDYKEEISNIKEDLTNINIKINKEYKNERKLFSIFKNQELMFMDSVSKIDSCEKVFELLSKFKSINTINNNKEKLFDYFLFLKSIITKYEFKSTNPVYLSLLKEMESRCNVKLAMTDKSCQQHGDDGLGYYYKKRHLRFTFDTFTINIRFSKSYNYDFEKVKNINLFFNLIEPIFTDDFIDYLEKISLSLDR